MFAALSDTFRTVFTKIAGHKKLTEDNISEGLNDVRLALLEADVQYGVAKTFITRVKEKAVGEKITDSVSASQQFVKIVHDELVALMGSTENDLIFDKKPASILMCGLQGSGKTTHSVKLASFLKKKGRFKSPCVVACDLQRPAAREQLKTLAASAQVACFSQDTIHDPLVVAKNALIKAQECGWDLIIFDTAGRLHIDEALMLELQKMKELVKPEEVLLVVNAATGQDAIKTAANFNEKLKITGTILSMLDGTSRGGAAISIREVTGMPIKFEGIGEKIDDLQVFNPTSMADRILGMGDTINLVRKAEEFIDKKDAEAMEKKLRTASFTFEDYLKQMQMVKKMGSMKSLLGMLPGMSKLKELDIDDKEIFKVEAIILSMTPQERAEKCELHMGRRRRIARGSGTSLDDVNRLFKSFKQAKDFFKNVPNMKQLEKMLGGNVWR
ncbi:MAG: signal recognition particle protein [Chlamydiales bacterium]|nr:signal recognition particle protein [Chlamydiales bacterium]